MKRKSMKTVLFAVTGLTLFLMLGTACTGVLNADPLEEGEYPSIVERFAERFNLDKDEIMGFLEELREEKRMDMEQKFEERLDELVEEGKLTAAQRQAILDKKQELEALKEGIGDMTVNEAKEALKDMKDELKDWAEENDIDLKFLFPNAAGRQGPRGIKVFGFGCRR